MLEVNGKVYPLWSQFVEDKEKWIGGVLEEYDYGVESTKIIDVELNPNGEDSAFFQVVGEGFTCGFDVSVRGISGGGEKGWITFSGYGGHTWRIKTK